MNVKTRWVSLWLVEDIHFTFQAKKCCIISFVFVRGAIPRGTVPAELYPGTVAQGTIPRRRNRCFTRDSKRESPCKYTLGRERENESARKKERDRERERERTNETERERKRERASETQKR